MALCRIFVLLTSGYPRGRKQDFVDEKQMSEEAQKMA